jgi:hypothetical protein
MDNLQRYLEAKMLYLEGIHLLIQHMTGLWFTMVSLITTWCPENTITIG